MCRTRATSNNIALTFLAHRGGLQASCSVTSRVRLPGWPMTLALALLDPGEWHGGPAELVAAGRRWQLVPRPTSWTNTLPLGERPQ